MNQLVNPSNTPQVYTEDGKTIPAGSRLEIDKLDSVGKAAVSNGRLVFEEDESKAKDASRDSTKAETSADASPATDADSTTATARRSQGGRK